MAPEMLSPDETAQLFANVVQKMNVTTQHHNANMSIMSNEDIIKQAVQLCLEGQHNQSAISMPPL